MFFSVLLHFLFFIFPSLLDMEYFKVFVFVILNQRWLKNNSISITSELLESVKSLIEISSLLEARNTLDLLIEKILRM